MHEMLSEYFAWRSGIQRCTFKFNFSGRRRERQLEGAKGKHIRGKMQGKTAGLKAGATNVHRHPANAEQSASLEGRRGICCSAFALALLAGRMRWLEAR